MFIASINGLAHFGNPAYSAAKAGLIAYSRAVATEFGRFGIRSNAICPGTVRTPAWARRIERSPGILERIGPERWRLVLPRPRWEATLTVVELRPAD